MTGYLRRRRFVLLVEAPGEDLRLKADLTSLQAGIEKLAPKKGENYSLKVTEVVLCGDEIPSLPTKED